MPGFLDTACAAARERADAARARVPLAALQRQAAEVEAPDFRRALSASPDVSVIAEVKRASPSRGRIAAIADPAALARAYVAGGAAAVSVLTEPRWFDGTLDDLAAVAAGVPVPVLRKDFVVDAYQVWEAKAAGAAAVLLIVAALDDAALRTLLDETAAAGIAPLVEVHDVAEAERAVVASGAVGSGVVVGVNTRDLATLEVDTGRYEALRAMLSDAPGVVALVAESGVAGPDDVTGYRQRGADAVLVGEHVAAQPDPAAAVAALVAAGRRRVDAAAGPTPTGRWARSEETTP